MALETLKDTARGMAEGAREIAATIREPAMMRVNPMVHGPKFVSPLEAAMFDESDAARLIRENARRLRRGFSFGLASRADDFSRGLDARSVNRIEEVGLDYGMILPANLSPVHDLGGVSAQILDHSVSSFFNNGVIKNSFVGRAADTVERKMKAEVALGGEEPMSIQHNIKFQVKASETKASMEYRGLTNADLSYSIAGRKTNLEVYEAIANGTNLVFTHSDEPNDRRDILSLRLHW